MIKLVTDEEDTVLDPFCGSGTTLVAAHLLKRKYIGIDQLKEAVELSKQRLNNPIKTESNLLKKTEQLGFPAFKRVLSSGGEDLRVLANTLQE